MRREGGGAAWGASALYNFAMPAGRGPIERFSFECAGDLESPCGTCLPLSLTRQGLFTQSGNEPVRGRFYLLRTARANW